MEEAYRGALYVVHQSKQLEKAHWFQVEEPESHQQGKDANGDLKIVCTGQLGS